VDRGGDLGEGYHLVVAQTDVDYKRPILFRPESYDCRTWVSRVGTTSVVFESVVRDGEEVLARARVVGVCVDNQTGRPARVPDAFRDVIPG
ncbi:MAG: thioesterase family protein, partial [Pedococcus sp.]